MKYIKRILWILSLFFIYLIFKEAVILYSAVKSLNIYLAYTIFGLFGFSVIWFILIPIIKLFSFRALFSPIENPDKLEKNLIKRNKHLRLVLNSKNMELEPIDDTGEEYKYLLTKLDPSLKAIRERYVSQLFISTSVSQNGFLDAILILSSSVNMIKEIFKTFNGRVSNRYVFIILKKVYISVAIGGSEIVESSVEELFSKLGSEVLNKVPGLNILTGSIADGFVNAALLTRVALLTENYCKMAYISSDKELFPGTKLIVNTTKHIVKGSIDMFKRSGAEKKGNIIQKWLGKKEGRDAVK